MSCRGDHDCEACVVQCDVGERQPRRRGGEAAAETDRPKPIRIKLKSVKVSEHLIKTTRNILCIQAVRCPALDSWAFTTCCRRPGRSAGRPTRMSVESCSASNLPRCYCRQRGASQPAGHLAGLLPSLLWCSGALLYASRGVSGQACRTRRDDKALSRC